MVYYSSVIEKIMASMGVSRVQLLKLGHPDLKKMKNFGGNMKRFSLLFILVFAVAAFGQEAVEAPAEEMMVVDSAAVDTMAMDEMPMDEAPAVEEAVVEEDSGDALEAMLAEEGTMETEVTNGSAMIGYTVGLMGGYPVYMSSGLGDGAAAPVFGLVFASPFGFAVGPFEIGIGAELGMYDFSDRLEYKGVVALATLNTALLETSQGAVTAELGGGYYGASLGATAGAAFNYAVPGIPLVAKPYVRANLTLDSGDGNDIGSVAWINAGIYLSYDISTLF
jgi:hypothetical protein